MAAAAFARFCLRAVALVPFVAAGCQAIAGIEERHYQPLVEAGAGRDAGAGREAGLAAEASPACKTYCKHVMDACFGDDAVYTVIDACYGVCAKLEARGLVGDFDEPGGNTVACRDKQAQNAAFGETKTFCPNAGPGGGDACGPDCQSYCMLYADICADVFPPLDNCLSACAVLKRSPPFNSVTDYGGDSLDCRLVHVSVASTDPPDHCPHARIAPPTAPCADDSDKAPTCEDYCRMTLGACGVGGGDAGAENAQYDSQQECIDVCGALTPGKNNEQAGNTVGCRLYHSYNVLGISVAHCPHTGPTGDGHCATAATATDRATDNCDPYCQIVAKACPDESKAHFGSDKDACHSECAKLSGVGIDSGYSIHTPDGPTVQCRVLHATRAFENRKECAAALGETTCK